jgi:E3 SUMO-protein ligase PIAS1
MCGSADSDTLDLNKLAAAGNVARIEHIRTQVNGSGDAPSSPSSPAYSNSPPPASSPHRSSLSQAPAQLQAPPLYSMPPNPSVSTGNSLTIDAPSIRFSDRPAGRLLFKTSPFFTIIRPLTGVVECKGRSLLSIRIWVRLTKAIAREHTRDHVDVMVTLPADVAAQLQSDQLYRVMVFCAPDTGLNRFSAADVAFPHQVELKVNLDDVKANLRGLKNKPGSTRPADITSFLRKKAGYNNQVTLTYALTQKVRPCSLSSF